MSIGNNITWLAGTFSYSWLHQRLETPSIFKTHDSTHRASHNSVIAKANNNGSSTFHTQYSVGIIYTQKSLVAYLTSIWWNTVLQALVSRLILMVNEQNSVGQFLIGQFLISLHNKQDSDFLLTCDRTRELAPVTRQQHCSVTCPSSRISTL